MFSDFNAMLRTCILTGVTRDILGTFHHRMNSDSVSHAREPFDLFIGYKSFFQKIHGNIDSLFCLFDQFAPVLRCKHSLSQSFQSHFIFSGSFFQFRFFNVTQIVCCSNSCNSSFNHGGTCFLDSGYITRYKDSFDRCLSVCIHDRNLSAPFGIIFHLTSRHLQ